jgi:hypothetical protein
MRSYKLLQRLGGSLQRIDGDAFELIHPQETIVEKPPINSQRDGAGDNAEGLQE